MDPLPLLPTDDPRCCGPAVTPRLDATQIAELTAAMEVLSHPIRLRLLAELAASPYPVCVCDLESSVPVKQPTVSHHLKLLRAAGLVESERRGLWAYYRVRSEELALLRQRITAGLDRLNGGEDE
jgi:ArsR family transcriptional regulator, arsenate/arsenite/antimonite-responsive transcriptional repressor